VVRNIDDLDGLACGFGLFGGTHVTLAAHLVRIPTVVADKLEALVRDMLGYRRYEVAGGKDLEVAMDLLIHAGAVDDRVACLIDLHLLDGERVADDVLGQALQVFALVVAPTKRSAALLGDTGGHLIRLLGADASGASRFLYAGSSPASAAIFSGAPERVR